MLVGDKVNYLTILSVFAKKGRKHFLVLCDCGTVKSIYAVHVKNGRTKSCGCLQRHVASVTHKGRKDLITHEGTGKRLYQCWASMKHRCTCSSFKQYSNYGGRGITICKEWEEYAPFESWALANGYADNLTIERIEVDGNYEPTNCEWITKSENSKRAKSTTNVCSAIPR